MTEEEPRDKYPCSIFGDLPNQLCDLTACGKSPSRP